MPTFRSSSSTNSAASTTIVISVPAGVVDGDVLLACITLTSNIFTVTPPAGWALVRSDGQVGLASYLYYKVASGEAGIYTWTFNFSTTSSGIVGAWSGASGTIGANVGQANASSTSIVAPTMTPAAPNSMSVMFGSINAAQAGGIADDGNQNALADTLVPSTPAMKMAEEPRVGVGATGSRTMVAANTAAVNNGQQVSLSPTAPLIEQEDSWSWATVSASWCALPAPSDEVGASLLHFVLEYEDAYPRLVQNIAWNPAIVTDDEASGSGELLADQEDGPNWTVQATPWTAAPFLDDELLGPETLILFEDTENWTPSTVATAWSPSVRTDDEAGVGLANLPVDEEARAPTAPPSQTWTPAAFADDEAKAMFPLDEELRWTAATVGSMWTAAPLTDDEAGAGLLKFGVEQEDWTAPTTAAVWRSAPFLDDEADTVIPPDTDGWTSTAVMLPWTAAPQRDDEVDTALTELEEPWTPAVLSAQWTPAVLRDDETLGAASFAVDQEEPWRPSTVNAAWTAAPASDDEASVRLSNRLHEDEAWTARYVTADWRAAPAADDETGPALTSFVLEDDALTCGPVSSSWSTVTFRDDETVAGSKNFVAEDDRWGPSLLVSDWNPVTLRDDETGAPLAKFAYEDDAWRAATVGAPWTALPSTDDEVSWPLRNFTAEDDSPLTLATVGTAWVPRVATDDEAFSITVGEDEVYKSVDVRPANSWCSVPVIWDDDTQNQLLMGDASFGFREPFRDNTIRSRSDRMPDPVVKEWLTTEAGRNLYFDFVNFPEVQAGEAVVAVVSGPLCDQAGPTFGPAVVTGTKVVTRVSGTFVAGVTYRMWVTVTTSAGNPLTCSGLLMAEDP